MMTHEESRAARKAKANEMAELYRQGKTLSQIGERWGVTRERVRQILKEIGITAKQGGASAIAKKKRDDARVRRDEKFLGIYGMTHAEYSATPAKARRAYANQCASARKRGIEWKFNLAGWWRVWIVSGKWEQRGRGQGYCMARKGDSGPYSPENVYICTISENFSDAWLWKPSHKRVRRSGEPLGKQIAAFGEMHSIVDWARIKGVCYNTLQARLKRGVPPEKALTISQQRTGNYAARPSQQEQRA